MPNKENKPSEQKDFGAWYVFVMGVGLTEMVFGLYNLYLTIKYNEPQGFTWISQQIGNGTLLAITGFLAFNNRPKK